jgi:hypothetical protein
MVAVSASWALRAGVKRASRIAAIHILKGKLCLQERIIVRYVYPLVNRVLDFYRYKSASLVDKEGSVVVDPLGLSCPPKH